MNGIVVGVDGSQGSERALAWAAAEARLRGAQLNVVMAWQWPTALYAGAGWAGVDGEVVEDMRIDAETRLQRICLEAEKTLAGLDVVRTAIESTPAHALVEASAGAELLVVGTRGHGGFAGLLLGSVSQQCAHHSVCPVVIIPPARDGT
jgi:nucleotide-binding universal stress UspA family protein